MSTCARVTGCSAAPCSLINHSPRAIHSDSISDSRRGSGLPTLAPFAFLIYFEKTYLFKAKLLQHNLDPIALYRGESPPVICFTDNVRRAINQIREIVVLKP